MTTPTVSAINWRDVPVMPPCPFYEKSAHRKTVAVVGALFTATVIALPIHPLLKYALVVLGTGLTATSAIFLHLYPSRNDPSVRSRTAEEAGKAIENGGETLSFLDISGKYSKLFDENILTEASLQTLMGREIAAKGYKAFIKRHGAEGRLFLNQENTNLLKSQFIAFVAKTPQSLVSLNDVLLDPTVINLKIERANIAAQIVTGHRERIEEACYTFAEFIEGYGKDAAVYLKDSQALRGKYADYVRGKHLPTSACSEELLFSTATFGEEFTNTLIDSINQEQFLKLQKGEIDYLVYREEITFQQLKANAEKDPEVKKILKASFLTLSENTIVSQKYYEDRQILEVGPEDVFHDYNGSMLYLLRNYSELFKQLKPTTERQAKLAQEIPTFTVLTEAIQLYGKEFLTSGWVTQSFIQQRAIAHLEQNAEIFLKLRRGKVPQLEKEYLPPIVLEIWGKAAIKVQAAKEVEEKMKLAADEGYKVSAESKRKAVEVKIAKSKNKENDQSSANEKLASDLHNDVKSHEAKLGKAKQELEASTTKIKREFIEELRKVRAS